MSKILDILLIGTVSFGAGWIFGPQIVKWTAKKIDETIPRVKDKLDQAKEGDDKMDKDLKYQDMSNVITVQRYKEVYDGQPGKERVQEYLYTYDIIDQLHLPSMLICDKGNWYVMGDPNCFLSNKTILKNSSIKNIKFRKENNGYAILPKDLKFEIIDCVDCFINNNNFKNIVENGDVKTLVKMCSNNEKIEKKWYNEYKIEFDKKMIEHQYDFEYIEHNFCKELIEKIKHDFDIKC